VPAEPHKLRRLIATLARFACKNTALNINDDTRRKVSAPPRSGIGRPKRYRKADADLQKLCWPLSRLGEALSQLSHRSRGLLKPADDRSIPENPKHYDIESLTSWMRMAAAGLGIEAEPAEVNYREIEAFLRQAGPALLRLPEMGDECVLALLGGRRRSLLVLGPDLMVYLVCAPQIRAAVWGSIEAPLRRNVWGVLDAAGMGDASERKRERIQAAHMLEQFGAVSVADI